MRRLTCFLLISIIALSFLSVFPLSVYADTPVFTDGFEDQTFDKWTDNGATSWLIGTTGSGSEGSADPHTGTYDAWSDATYKGFLRSDNIDMSDASEIYVSFWHQQDDTEPSDIYLHYGNGTIENLIGNLDTGDDVWTQYTENITDSQYFTSNFYIAFESTCGTNENVWIDDVEIYKTTAAASEHYSFDLPETVTPTEGLESQKDIYSTKSESTVTSGALESRKTLTRTSGESTSVTSTLQSSKGLTEVFTELFESTSITASLLTQKTLSFFLEESSIITGILGSSKAIFSLLGETVAVNLNLQAVKSILEVLKELSEAAETTASMIVRKGIKIVFGENGIIDSFIDIIKAIIAKLFETINPDSTSTIVSTGSDAVVLDSLSEVGQSTSSAIYANHPSSGSSYSAVGQSFTTPATPTYTLDSVVFYCYRSGNNARNVKVRLYAHSGTYGSSSAPTGAALAESDVVAVLNVDTSYELVTFTFSGVNRIELDPATYYCIAAIGVSGVWDSGNRLYFGQIFPSAHDGNAFYYANSAWVTVGVRDTCFYVYGEEVVEDVYSINYVSSSQNSTMIGTNAVLSAVWSTNGTFTDCGFIFGWNFTGSFANETYTAFSGAGSPQMGNTTKSLGDNVTMWGYTVQWQVWANCSGGNWNTTGLLNFNLSAVRLEYTIGEYGSLLVDGVSQGNTTETYLPSDSLEFSAVPNWNYTLDAFTLNSVEYEENPLDCTFNVTDYTSDLEQMLAVTFSAAGVGVADTGELESEWIAIGFLICIIVVCVVAVMLNKRKE